MKLTSFTVLFVCACAAQTASTTPSASAGASSGGGATASIEGRSGSALTGNARFQQESSGLKVHVELQGATPGEHGLHVHEKGDCTDSKAASAGGHFNPGAAEHHGGPDTAVRHGGDLGNITVDASGKGTLDVTVHGLSLDGASDAVTGRAIVVHEKIDDLKSDPAGNSGARIGCGVIQAAAR